MSSNYNIAKVCAALSLAVITGTALSVTALDKLNRHVEARELKDNEYPSPVLIAPYNGESAARREALEAFDRIKGIELDLVVPVNPVDKGDRVLQTIPGGSYYITNYCACSICCGPYGTGTCADGTHVSANPLDHSVAADPSIPFGTRFMIPELTGDEVYVVHDRGSAVHGRHFDVYQQTHSEALSAPSGNYEIVFIQD